MKHFLCYYSLDGDLLSLLKMFLMFVYITFVLVDTKVYNCVRE